jgi:hypothetical protein
MARRRIPLTNIAYILLLLGFVSLGLFVAALALGSKLAIVAGLALIASAAGSVAGFRAAARKLTEARGPNAPTNNVSILSTPIQPKQVDRYREMYRNQPADSAPSGQLTTVVTSGESKEFAASSTPGRHHRAA